jgi:hypothetical protein
VKRFLVPVSFLLFLATATVKGDEEKIALDKLPKVVVQMVKKAYPKAEMKEAVKEVANDKTSYEVMVKDGETDITITLTSEGAITLIEKEIPLKSVPKVVMAAVMAKYPKAKPTKAEKLFKIVEGKEAFDKYEVIIDADDKKDLEVYVTEDGKIVSQ